MFGRRYPVSFLLQPILTAVTLTNVMNLTPSTVVWYKCPVLLVNELVFDQLLENIALLALSWHAYIQVGLLDEEKILPLGAEITAVGELYSAPDGTPVIKSSKRLPIFLYVNLTPTISSCGIL